MPAENWELVFKEYLIGCAHAVAADLKDIDMDAVPRGHSFAALMAGGLFCPECWVRYGETITLHQKRWLASCGEHDYKLP
ncbi:MAG: hypothetical protein ABI740_08175 [Alphaproteobacteria bacterium]